MVTKVNGRNGRLFALTGPLPQDAHALHVALQRQAGHVVSEIQGPPRQKSCCFVPKCCPKSTRCGVLGFLLFFGIPSKPLKKEGYQFLECFNVGPTNFSGLCRPCQTEPQNSGFCTGGFQQQGTPVVNRLEGTPKGNNHLGWVTHQNKTAPNLLSLEFDQEGLYPYGPCTCNKADTPAKYSDAPWDWKNIGAVASLSQFKTGSAWNSIHSSRCFF